MNTRIMFLGCLLIAFFVSISYAGDTWETSGERWVTVEQQSSIWADQWRYDDIQIDYDTPDIVESGNLGKGDVASTQVIFWYCTDSGVKVQEYSTGNRWLISPFPNLSLYENNVDRECCPQGTSWDSVSEQCECPDGSVWSEETEACEVVPDCSSSEAAENREQCHEAAPQGMSVTWSCMDVTGGFVTDCSYYDPNNPDENSPVDPYELEPTPDPSQEGGEDGEPPVGNGEPVPYEETPGLDITLEPDRPDTDNSQPADNPVAQPSTEDGQQLGALKEDLGTLVKQVGTLVKDSEVANKNDVIAINSLQDIKRGIAMTTQNQVIQSKQLSAINDNTGKTVQGLGEVVKALGKVKKEISELDNDGQKIPDTVTQTGDIPTLAPDNVYDVEVDTVLTEEEGDQFFTVVTDYITENMPIINYINGSELTVSGASPVLSTTIWGKEVRSDISQWQGLLNKAGLVLIAVATMIGFQIIVARVA